MKRKSKNPQKKNYVGIFGPRGLQKKRLKKSKTVHPPLLPPPTCP